MMNNSNQEALIEFNPKLPKLSKNEKEVLKILVEAGKLIVPIYLEQEKEAQTKIDRKEVENAAKRDLFLLSRYTTIEKIDGKLAATPYHIKYADLLIPVVQKLEQAANVTTNKEFGNALRVQAKALLKGTYEEAVKTWLKIKPHMLDISIGPLDHYDDRLPFSKASYHAWIGVIDKEGTDRLNNYKHVTLSAQRKAIVPEERLDLSPERIKAKVIDVVLFSGIMARTKFVGLNLPYDVEIVGKCGTQVTLFNQPNDLRVKEQILPVFKKIFSKGFREGFVKEDLRRGYLRAVALHELAHSYLYYKNAYKNLENLFDCIYELAATVLGLRLAGTLLLKNRITEKQLESMIVAFTSRCFYLTGIKKNTEFMKIYALGGAVFINFMLESGALKKFNNIFVMNFTKMFVSIHDLSYILENLLSRGFRKDAESFINKSPNRSNP